MEQFTLIVVESPFVARIGCHVLGEFSSGNSPSKSAEDHPVLTNFVYINYFHAPPNQPLGCVPLTKAHILLGEGVQVWKNGAPNICG